MERLPKSASQFNASNGSTQIFFTGRPHVREDIQKYFTKAVVIPITPKTDNISNYLEMRLDGNPEEEAMGDDLWVDIVRAIRGMCLIYA